MKIAEVKPKNDYTFRIIWENGKSGLFDVKPYLKLEAFSQLTQNNAFNHVSNGGYFIEWECGADLSADTIECRLLCD